MFINDKLASETPEGSAISRGVESALFILTTCQPFETKRKYIWSPAVLTYGALQMSRKHELHLNLPQSFSLMMAGLFEF